MVCVAQGVPGLFLPLEEFLVALVYKLDYFEGLTLLIDFCTQDQF